MEDKIEIFIAYNREDAELLRELKDNLKSLETEGLVTIWDPSQIVGGSVWKQVIDSHLKTASIILLLVSARFMASNETYTLAKQAVARNAPPNVYVVPVLLHEVDWEYSILGKLAPLPTDKRPIGSWPNRNAAFLNVVRGVRGILEQLKAASVNAQLSTPVSTNNSAQGASVEGYTGARLLKVGKVIIPDQLEFKVEEQEWAPVFPRTTIINEAQARALNPEIDVVIITANDTELRAAMHKLEPYRPRRSVLLAYIGPETYYLGKFGAYKAVVTKCRMGSIGEGSVILAAQQAQIIWGPRAIIMVGVAFGKDPTKQHLGDVLVASQIVPYEGQRVGTDLIFRNPIPPSNAVLLNRFENAPTWHFVRPKPDGKACNLQVGPILSGEKLVDDPDFKAWLFKRFPAAIGGEMEGAGLCAVAGRFGVAWILVKSICDWGDGHKQDLYQPLAAAAAVSLVHHVLAQKTALNSIEKR